MKFRIMIAVFVLTAVAFASCKGKSPPVGESETVKKTDDTAIISTTEQVEEDPHQYDWQYNVKPYYPYEDEIEGDYIFNVSYCGHDILVLKRNVHTGECTTVCKDPFCTHDNPSCLFYVSLYVTGIGNTMYGIRADTENSTNYIYSYNVDTDEYKIVFGRDYPLYMEELFPYGHYLFFYVSSIKENGIKRLNLNTGELENVKRQQNYEFFAFRDGMIMWMRVDELNDVYVATDLLGNDPRPYNPLIYNGSLHKHELIDFKSSTAYRLNREGEIEKKLYEFAGHPTRIKESTIYFKLYEDLENHPVYPDRPEEGMTLTTGDIYIMPIDTEESRLLCHVDGVRLQRFGTPKNPLICGDWVGIIIYPTKSYSKRTGFSAADNDMVIVNMKTGEYHVSRLYEE